MTGARIRRWLGPVAIVLPLAFVGSVVGRYLQTGTIPFIYHRSVDGLPWSIGIYRGDDLFALSGEGVANPVLSGADLGDSGALVADPFMLRHDGVWYLFFETVPGRRGSIAYATSDDGSSWRYGGIALEERFHLSYPHVFADGGEIYMIPETRGANAVRLYRATAFPDRWALERELIAPCNCVDPTPFRVADTWYLLVTRDDLALELYVANDLEGPWRPHPESPVVKRDPHAMRSAGRVVAHGGRLVRFAQSGLPIYGAAVNAFVIERISPTTYRERPWPGNPLLEGSGQGWNEARMHHIDAHRLEDGTWLAAVDGNASGWQVAFSWRDW